VINTIYRSTQSLARCVGFKNIALAAMLCGMLLLVGEVRADDVGDPGTGPIDDLLEYLEWLLRQLMGGG
jgi:hypothetical protein